MSQVKVLSLATGRVVLMDEAVAYGYYRLDGRYVVGSPINDAFALRQSFWGHVEVVATVPINWKSMPTIASGGGDYVLAPDNYLNDDPSKPLLNVTGLNRRVIVVGLPGQVMRMRSRGDLIQGYNARLRIQNARLELANPAVKGQCPGKVISCDDFQILEFWNNLVIGSSGISLGTAGGKRWKGVAANGDRLRVERNRWVNVRGQRSDGTRDASDPMRVIPIRSNWGPTHNPAYRWNPSVAAADRTTANQSDPAKYGELGWSVGNFIQIRYQPGLVDSRIGDNEVIGFYGEERGEDRINLYGGTGGTATSPLMIEGNYIKATEGLDWNWTKGQGMTYDNSNRVVQGATSYQDTGQTGYSGTISITDGWITGSDSTVVGAWELSMAWVVFKDTVGVGSKISIQSGHNIRLINNALYEVSTTADGSPLSTVYTGYQITRYDDDGGAGAQAKNNNGVMVDLWGANEMSGCTYYAGGTDGGDLVGHSPTDDLMMNGGTYSNNTKFKRKPMGFEAQLLADWRAAKANAGLTIGLTG